MAIRLRINVPDPADILSGYGVGALVRVERSATETGTYTEITTLAVVAGTTVLEYWDAAGSDTSWYQNRYSNAAGSELSDYSAPWSPGTPTAYATVDDILPLFETRPNASRFGRLEKLLQIATDEFIEECGGRDYFRHPASGTESWLAAGDGSDVLHVHEGLVALTTVEISLDRGATFEALTGSQWTLEGRTPHDSSPIPTREPAFHVRLVFPFDTISRFSPALGTVRLTGARGWPSIPSPLREGIAQRARQMAYGDPSFSGSVPGPSEYNAGGSTFERWPQILWRYLDGESDRFWCDL